MTFSQPTGVAVSPGGAIGISDASGVRVFATNEAPESAIPDAGGVRFALGHANLFDLQLMVVARIRRFARTGRFVSAWSIFQPVDGRTQPVGLDGFDADAAGRVWAANYDAGTVRAYSPAGHPFVSCLGKPSLASPETARDIAAHSPSDVYMTTGALTMRFGPNPKRGQATCRVRPLRRQTGRPSHEERGSVSTSALEAQQRLLDEVVAARREQHRQNDCREKHRHERPVSVGGEFPFDFVVPEEDSVGHEA